MKSIFGPEEYSPLLTTGNNVYDFVALFIIWIITGIALYWTFAYIDKQTNSKAALDIIVIIEVLMFIMGIPVLMGVIAGGWYAYLGFLPLAIVVLGILLIVIFSQSAGYL